MRVRPPLFSGFTALLVVLLLSAACGGGSSDTSVSSGGGSDDGPQSFEDIDFSSPIGDFLGVDYGFSEDNEAEYAEMEREAGRLTAQCMLDKGFEYTPPDNSRFVSFGPGGSGDDPPYFSDAWVEKYGFGITTQRFPQSQVGDLVGFPDEGFGPDEDFVDPNEDYVESLGEAEREAYYEALYGLPPDFGPEGPTEEQMMAFEPTGCQNEAQDEVFNNNNGVDQQAFFQAFGDDLMALEERMQADPRVVEFNDEVSKCVADEGMEYSGSGENLYERFEDRLNEVQPAMFGPTDPFEEAGLDPEQMSEEEIQDFIEELNRIDPAGLTLLAELQAEELELARVVVGCGGGPLQEQILMSEVRVQYEQEFLDANAAALEEFAG